MGNITEAIKVEFEPGDYRPPSEKVGINDPDFYTADLGTWTPPSLTIGRIDVARLSNATKTYSSELARVVFDEAEQMAKDCEHVTYTADTAFAIARAIDVCQIPVELVEPVEQTTHRLEPDYPELIAVSLR